MTPETLSIIMAVGGGLLSVLNLVVAFFLKSIHSDFKAAVAKLNDHSERLGILEYRISQLDGQPARTERRKHG